MTSREGAERVDRADGDDRAERVDRVELADPVDRRAFAAAILAGGASRRMGQDKASLRIGGGTLLERAVALVRPLVAEVRVVGGDGPLPAGVSRVPDAEPGAGPLAAIATALRVPRPWVLVVACDTPLLSPDVLDLLVAEAAGAEDGVQAVMPRHVRGVEPLVALYRTSALAAVEALVASGERAARALAVQLTVHFVEEAALREVDPDLVSFTNLNTPEDVERASALLVPPSWLPPRPCRRSSSPLELR